MKVLIDQVKKDSPRGLSLVKKTPSPRFDTHADLMSKVHQ
jgi:hypothetical protein